MKEFSKESKYYLDQQKIMEFLPHRYPFLLVDRVLDISGPGDLESDDLKDKKGVKVVALKNVTMNEPFFQGHFPGVPVMPGVLLVEAMAQVASFSMYPYAIQQIRSVGEAFQCVLVGVNEARFRAPVTPGDTLVIKTEVVTCRKFLWSFKAEIFVEDKLVAEAGLLANLVPSSKKKVF